MASRLGVARAEHGLYTAEHLRVLDEVQTPVWMLERGEGSKVVWNNHAFLEIFGKSQSVVDKGQWHPPMPPSLKVKHQQIHGEVELVEDGGSFSNSRSNGECSTSGRGVHMVSESGMIPGPNGAMMMYDLHMSGIRLQQEDGTIMVCTMVQASKYSVQETTGKCEHEEVLAGVHEMHLLKMMHMHSPIFIMLFTGDGKLLKANPSAVSYFGSDSFGLETLFLPGQQWVILKEREEPLVFESVELRGELMAEIFKSFQRKEHVRVQQLTESRKHTGQLRWSELEMWPIEDPVNGGDAVLVNQTNITRLKETEVKLRDAHLELSNLNNELKVELALAKEELASASTSHITLDVVTPVDKALALLEGMLEGNMPSMAEVERLQHTLATSHNLREPVGLSDQLRELVKHQRLDDDVAGALGDMLQGKKLDGNSLSMSKSSSFSNKLLAAGELDDMRIGSAPVFGTSGIAKIPPRRSPGLEQAAGGAEPAEERAGGGGAGLGMLDEVEMMRPRLRPVMMSDTSSPATLRDLARRLRDEEPIPAAHVALVEELVEAEQWAWDPWKLHDVTKGHPLSTLTFWLFARHNLIETFRIDEDKLMMFLAQVEAGYPDNLYHNRTHAADVVQTMHIVMSEGGLMHSMVGDMELMAGLLAAAVHDFEHKGLDNNFLIRNQDPLAILYNDRSPMENHHLSGAFRLLAHPKCSFLENLTVEQHSLLRQLVIDMVLATDMKNHFQILSQFQSRLEKRFLEKKNSDGGGGIRRRSSLSCVDPDGGGSAAGEEEWVPEDSDKCLALQVALKIADVGHFVARVDVHKRWVRCLEEEFFRQGDLERGNNAQVSFLMDREKPGVTKSQVGFFDIVVFPLIRSWINVFPRSQSIAEMVEANYGVWKDLDEASKKAAGGAEGAEGGAGPSGADGGGSHNLDSIDMDMDTPKRGKLNNG